jgi:hypothetical protein
MQTQATYLEFEKLLHRHQFKTLWRKTTGKPTQLWTLEKCFGERNIRNAVDKGIQVIKVEQIVGSMDGNQNFDIDFNPTHDEVAYRWVKIREAYDRDVLLPPIEVYEAEGYYYVVDGHHRVSVARSLEQVYIDAHVHSIVFTD